MKKSKNPYKPQFENFVQFEEDVLAARLSAIRSAIQHGGEKGRALEADVRRLLRGFLPPEYGTGSGFVASIDDRGMVKLSKQLDLIIYDAHRSAPLIDLGTCEVYPLEAVYAYVEIKGALTKANNLVEPTASSLEGCLKDNAKLRELRNRIYWTTTNGSPQRVRQVRYTSLAIRSYVIAFEAAPQFGTLAKFAQRLASMCKHFGAHMHGVYAADLGFVYTKPVDPISAPASEWYRTVATEDSALLVLKTAMLQALATFTRVPTEYAPAVDRYYKVLPTWNEFSPDGI